MKQSFLSPAPRPPAIREAMVNAAERREKGLPVFDFSSGNVGNLALNQKLFAKLDLEVNDNLPAGLKMVADGLREGIENSYYPSPQGLAYSPTGGTDPIKKLVVQFFREIHGVPLADVETNRVIATAGGQQAMAASLRSLRKDTSVLVSRWEYAPIPGILQDHGLKEVRIEADEDLSIDLDSLQDNIVKGSVFYISMPNNPTGYVSPKDLETILEIVSANEGGVIWDAPYLLTIVKVTSKGAEFDKGFLEKKLAAFRLIAEMNYEKMCILSSLSKSCLIAGLRFGAATASKQWIGNMNAIIGRENLSSPTPSFVTAAAILRRFLENPISYEWVCKVLAKRLTILMEEVADHLMLPGNGSFGALYVLVKTRQDGTKFAQKLLRNYGIVTVAGNQFYGAPVDAVRISLVSVPWSEDDHVWVESVETLKKALG